jgi:hypothetical protein
VEHRALTKLLRLTLFVATAFTSCHLFPWSRASSFTVRFQVFFGLPLFLLPWGFQSKASFSVIPDGLRSVCPIQDHFLFFVYLSDGFCPVCCQNSSFVTVSGHLIRRIFRKHLFINDCMLLLIFAVLFHVSHLYSKIHLTLDSNIRILGKYSRPALMTKQNVQNSRPRSVL